MTKPESILQYDLAPYNLAVGDSIPPEFTDTYVLEMKFMHGDADHYNTLPFKVSNPSELRILIDCCKWYLHLPYYQDTRGFTLDDAPMFPPEWKDEYDDYIEWPRDITGDGDYKAVLCSYKALYYDNLGRAYEIIESDK